MRFYTNEQATKQIKAIRTLAGFTQAEMADKLGITVKVYSKYENNPYSVPIAKLEPVANLLGCTVGDFFVDRGYSKSVAEAGK